MSFFDRFCIHDWKYGGIDKAGRWYFKTAFIHPERVKRKCSKCGKEEIRTI